MDAPRDPPLPMPRPTGWLARVERGLAWLNGFFVTVGMLALVFFCFAQAVDRYTVKSSFDAHDQLAKVGLVWLVFCGMALGYAARENLRIDLFARHLSRRWLALREAVFEALTLAVCVLIHWKAWAVIDVSAMQPILGTPLTNAVPYSAILLGTVSIGLTCLVRLMAMAMPRARDAA
jgi:TRAP-type C4-dicarboxylate transport system permease small subunit